MKFISKLMCCVTGKHKQKRRERGAELIKAEARAGRELERGRTTLAELINAERELVQAQANVKISLNLVVDSDDEDLRSEEEALMEFDEGFGNVIEVENLPVVSKEKFEKSEGVVRKIDSQYGLWMLVGDQRSTLGCCFIEYNTPQFSTERFVQWSPMGTYLATIHRQGAAVWGGATTFNRLMRYAHPQVELIDFSFGERSLVTYSSQEPSNPGDTHRVVINIFDVRTGKLMRDFKGSADDFAAGGTGGVTGVSWPVFSVFTPYYGETVLYSSKELQEENEDGIFTLFYLQKIFSVRGMLRILMQCFSVFYRIALMLQSFLKRRTIGVETYSHVDSLSSQGFELANQKCTSCQIYGQQKQQKLPQRSNEESMATGGVTGVSWPVFRWGGGKEDKYFARLGKNVISVYKTETFTLIDKKSIKVDHVVDFCWSPTDPIFALFVPELGGGNQPARVNLVQVPSKEELRQKNIFSVSDCKMYWQSKGEYLAVKVDRYTTYTGFELFRIKERDIPIEVLELENIIAFAWEPKGHRFAVIHGDNPRPDISFYSMRSGTNTGWVSKLTTLKGKQFRKEQAFCGTVSDIESLPQRSNEESMATNVIELKKFVCPFEKEANVKSSGKNLDDNVKIVQAFCMTSKGRVPEEMCEIDIEEPTMTGFLW